MIEIIATGQLNTVQDLGRRGLRHLGIGTSGAMDSLALRIGNLLVGNDENAAGIEIQTFPFTLRFGADVQIAVTGAAAPANRLGERPLLPWWSYAARAGDMLVLKQPLHGARSYVSFGGGIDVPLVLGSRSTHMRNAFGGHHGRALVAGDRLPLLARQAGALPEIGVLPPDLALPAGGAPGVLPVRAIPGADYPIFPEAARQALWSGDWTISVRSDRAGYRLTGAPLHLAAPVELRSYGVIAGIVQIPPAGQPIVQLADANTAGGYPRMAGVIEADLWRLAQAPLGGRIRFVETSYPEAMAALAAVDTYLDELRRLIRPVRGAMTRSA